MAMGRRPQEERGLFAIERPPRLVLRFAIVLSIALALASGLILVLVRSFTVSQAESSATRQASLVTATLLQREVRRSDFLRPVDDSRRASLDGLLRRHLVPADILGMSLVRGDGLVTYSTDHRFIGERVSPALATEAATGVIVSRTSTSRAAGAPEGTQGSRDVRAGRRAEWSVRALRRSSSPTSAIERDAQRALLWVGGVLEALLLVLFAIFVPALARVSRRIRRQIETIHFQGFYDELTGLPNRAHLRQRLALALERAEAGGRQVAVLLLDLHNFREINDTLGQAAGDSVLRAVGSRLEVLLDRDTLLARYVGDEFAIVLEFDSDDAVSEIAERARAAVERPLVVDGVPIAVDASVGSSVFPTDGSDAETILRHAEVAMHTAKSWRVGVLSYSPAVDPHDPEQLVLLGELRDAASRRELVPHFQPKVELSSRKIVGFELLTYWQHPARGLLPPGAFIPLAERTGAIRHLSRAVLELALKQLTEWRDLRDDLAVSVNLTAIDLLDLELPDQLEELSNRYGVAPPSLCLEITETTIMADLDRGRSVLDRLAAIGFQLSVDDFGTGYSSLSYLKNLPAHEVKIDRSLVSGIATNTQDRTIVRATIEMAHSLGLRVVAEGVETSAQESLLRNLDCDQAQGFLYARALPASEIDVAVASWEYAAA